VRRIKADYSFRVNIEQIRGQYATCGDALDAGDFNIAASFAEDAEDRACGLLMAGFVEKGRAELDRCEAWGDRAILCAGYAAWISGDRADALALLARIPDGSRFGQAAAALADYIRRDVIPVLCLAVIPGGYLEPPPMDRTTTRFGQFLMGAAGTQLAGDDCALRPDWSIASYVEELPPERRPAFCLTLGSQWFAAPGIESLQIPRIIYHNDFDILYHRAADNFQFQDINIVCTSQEHHEIRHTLGKPCFTMMAVDLRFAPFPPFETAGEKDIALFYSGRALEPFETDRSRLLFELSRLSDDHRILFVDGHAPKAEYIDLLRRARLQPVVSRYAGCPSPRWREALTYGSTLLFPDGTMYDRINAGCLPFRADRLNQDVGAILDQGSAVAPSAIRADAEAHLSGFREPAEKQVERFLKYCCLCQALAPIAQTRQLPREDVAPRRTAWLMPSVDTTGFPSEQIYRKAATLLQRVRHEDWRDEKDAANHTNALNCLATFVGFSGNLEGPGLEINGRVVSWPSLRRTAADAAEKLLASAVTRFPDSLLLRYNQAIWRTLAANHGAAREAFQEIVDQDSHLRFDPIGSDVAGTQLHWRDPGMSHFDYADNLTSWLLRLRGNARNPARPVYEPRDALLAASHTYLGLYARRAGDTDGAIRELRKATRLFPPNWKSWRDLFVVIRERITGQANPSKALKEELVDAFYHATERYPALLLRHLGDVIAVVEECAPPEEAETLVLDWARFHRCVHNGTIGRLYGAEENLQSVVASSTAQRLFKDRIETWSSWSVADVARDLSHLDRAVLAAHQLRQCFAGSRQP
jgi:tetratricopeptide (TPR) repeat protein